MLTGSCLCGEIHYEVLMQDLGTVFFCHCSNCRKANGSAFAANIVVDTDKFRLISGAEKLNEYESSPGVFRVFCSTCATPIMSRRPSQPDSIRLRIGSLDSPLTLTEAKHIFVDSKASWFTICDQFPQYSERP